MARVPFDSTSSRTWTEDTATVIFGDDLVEDFVPGRNTSPNPVRRNPSAPGENHTKAAVSWPLSTPARAADRAPSLPASMLKERSPALASAPQRASGEKSDSGLDSLRPYVGSQPQIIVGGDDWDTEPLAAPRPSRAYLVKGFAWGLAAASLLFAVAIFHQRKSVSGAGAEADHAPVHVDVDALLPEKPLERPLDERAAAGEKDALAQLKEKSPTSLTPEEAAGIARGEEVRDRRRAKEVVEALATQRSFSPADQAEFFKHAGNQRTFRVALLAMAKNESEAGPDLIYQVMRSFRHQEDIADFARSLLMTPAVYKYASPAMTVIIDAETVTECTEVRQLVDRVAEDGDARSVRHMAKFAKTHGCGEHGASDCYRCLRGDRALVDALRAAQDRRAPY